MKDHLPPPLPRSLLLVFLLAACVGLGAVGCRRQDEAPPPSDKSSSPNAPEPAASAATKAPKRDANAPPGGAAPAPGSLEDRDKQDGKKRAPKKSTGKPITASEDDDELRLAIPKPTSIAKEQDVASLERTLKLAEDMTNFGKGGGGGRGRSATRCKQACSALASMQAAASRICELAGKGSSRCQSAQGRLKKAQARVKDHCGECTANGQ